MAKHQKTMVKSGVFMIWHLRNRWGHFSPRWLGPSFRRDDPAAGYWRLHLGVVTVCYNPPFAA